MRVRTPVRLGTAAGIAMLLFFLSSGIAAAQSVRVPIPSARAEIRGLNTYQFILLRRSPNPAKLSEDEANRIQASHMANIQRMAQSGELVAAGPLGDEPSIIAGFFIFRMPRLSDALTLAANDPTVVEHRNTVEGFTWLAPPGLGEEYSRIHAADPKAPVNMQMHPVCFLHARSKRVGAKDLRDALRVVESLHRDGALASGGGVVQEDKPRPLAVLIFRSVGLPEAQQQMTTHAGADPARFTCEWHQWYSADHVLTW